MEIEQLLNQLKNPSDEFVYKASDRLALIENEQVMTELLVLLQHENHETRFLAARTLGAMKDNSVALEPMFEAINDKKNASIQGDLVMTLEGFDLSNSYVEIFKLYLFGSFKVSKMAKELLDYEEFNITQRVIKKALKHWNHYTNNAKHDDAFELRKIEVEEIIEDLKNFLGA